MAETDQPPLYLRKVSIKNVRCFKNLTIDLSSETGTRQWAVVFGDNGVGKTTLLRCIAMGLCDSSSAGGLLREIYGEWNRAKDTKLLTSVICLELQGDEGPVTITTRVKPQKSGYSQVSQTYSGRRKSFPWGSIFACGYGAARRSFGTKDVADYATIDSVYTLFNYDTALQNPELVLRRIESGMGPPHRNRTQTDKNPRSIGKILDSISAVLMLPPGSIRLSAAGLTIKGPWGRFQPIGAVGDGYQATLGWVVDFLGWAIFYDPRRPLTEVRGIVLVDELEQHLHPRWQREIIRVLSDQFPKVQFIATTHTPLVAVGTTELGDDDCELIKLERRGDQVIARENLKPPRGQRVDQIVTSLLFDLPTAGDDATVADIARLNRLSTNEVIRRSDRLEIERLRARLAEQFNQAESDFETTITREVRRALESQSVERIDRIAADYEVMRQLREMASDEKA